MEGVRVWASEPLMRCWDRVKVWTMANHGCMTSKELAKQWGVTRRVAKRDVHRILLHLQAWMQATGLSREALHTGFQWAWLQYQRNPGHPCSHVMHGVHFSVAQVCDTL